MRRSRAAGSARLRNGAAGAVARLPTASPPRANAASYGCRFSSAPASGVYFVLKVEPPLWPGIAAAVAGPALAFVLRRRSGWREAVLAFTVFAAGFALMCETAWERGAPMLQRHLGPVAVTGRVVDIDVMEKGWRIVIDNDPLSGLDPADQPRRLRVHIPQAGEEINPGDRVSLRAMLYPVPAQILPGGRDFQRELYFAGIGGVGYTFGSAHRTT